MAVTSEPDPRFMDLAMELAHAAGEMQEVPVGAVVVQGGKVIGQGANRCVVEGSPLAHAEMIALNQAFVAVGDPRLPDAEIYCSLEPCFMCTGAILHARLRRIVFAARDPKFGACGSLAELPSDSRLNHRCAVHEGIGAEESAALLRAFFQRLR